MSRDKAGLPWWLSDKESAYQCRRHRFDSLGVEDLLEKEMAMHSRHNLATKQQQEVKLLYFFTSLLILKSKMQICSLPAFRKWNYT